MKRLSDRARVRARLRMRRLRRRSRKLAQRRLLMRSTRTVRRRATFYSHGTTKRVWVDANGWKMPSQFSLDTNFEEVAAFIREFLDRTWRVHADQKFKAQKQRPTTPKWFDIASIKSITPTAALMLASVFDLGRRLNNRKLSAINHNDWAPEVLRVFQQLGVFSVLDIDGGPPIIESKDGELLVLAMRSGTQTLGAEVSELVEALAEVVLTATGALGSLGQPSHTDDLIRAHDIFSTIIEAMGNVAEHAYPADQHRIPKDARRWWLTAAFNQRERTLTVALYDHGISIPVSLPNWQEFERAERLFQRIMRFAWRENAGDSDGLAIGVAMKVAVSRTRSNYRGKGLGEMKRFVDFYSDGVLRIWSRRGLYIHRKGCRDEFQTLRTAIVGTLVEWRLRL